MRRCLLIGLAVICLAGVWAWRAWLRPAAVTVENHTPAQQQREPMLKLGTDIPVAASPSNAPAASSLSSAVRDYLDAARHNPTRHARSCSLPAQASPADVRALSEFVCQAQPWDGTEFGQGVKNEVLDYLCDLNPEGLRDLLVRMSEDRSLNAVVRDYALQHLTEHWQRLAEGGEVDLPQRERAEIVRALWNAVGETDSSIAGTALLGLSRLSEVGTGIDRSTVAAAALRLAADPATGEATRIASLQVCGRLQLVAALPATWEAARNSGSLPLRIAAIGTLGRLADADARPFLSGLEHGEASALRPAARQALRELARREHQSDDLRTPPKPRGTAR